MTNLSGSVLSEEADLTCRALMTQVAQMERTLLAAGTSYDSGLIRQKIVRDAIVGIVVSVETFTFSRIVHLVASEIHSLQSHVATALYGKIAANIDKSWDSVANASRDYLNRNLRAIDGWRKMMALVDVRNSAVHAGGYLTRKQESDNSVRERMKLIDVRIDHRFLSLHPKHAESAARIARSFVMDVDELTWYPVSHR